MKKLLITIGIIAAMSGLVAAAPAGAGWLEFRNVQQTSNPCRSGHACVYPSTDGKVHVVDTSGNDAVAGGSGGGGSVSLTCGSGLTCSPTTITGTGSVTPDTTVLTTLSGSQTLTGKTLAAPVITGTMSLPANALLSAASSATNTVGVTLAPSVADGAASSAFYVNNANATSTAGFAYQSWGAASTEQAALRFNGTSVIMGGARGTSTSAVGFNTSELDLYPSGAGGASIFVANTQIAPFSPNAVASGSTGREWSNTASYWYSSPTGSALTSAATITPTSALHHVTGTVSVTTIATTNVPATGALTLVCDAACVFGTGGNISVGFTGVANSSYEFVWDGTAWRPQGNLAGAVTAAATLVGGVIPVANSATTVSNGVTGSRATLQGYLNLTPQAVPASPANGDLWYDSSHHVMGSRVLGLTTAIPSIGFTSTATTTITTTTAGQTLIGTGVGTLTLPANFCVVGKTIHEHVGLVGTWAAAPGTLAFSIIMGGTPTTVATTGAITPQASVTRTMTADVYITYRSCGASGSVMTNGVFTYISGSSVMTQADLSNNGSTTTIDTTSSGALNAVVTLSATGNSLLGTNYSYEVLN